MSTTLNEIYLKYQKENVESITRKTNNTRVSFECYIEKIVESESNSKVNFTLRDGMNKISAYLNKNETKDKNPDLNEKSKLSEIPIESFVNITGILETNNSYNTISFPNDSTIPLLSVRIEEIKILSKCESKLPVSLSEVSISNRNENPSDLSKKYEETLKNTNQRFLSLRLVENQAIFSIKSKLKNLFRTFFLQNDCIEIETPKLLPYLGVAEDQSFRVNYFGREVYLNQHSALHMMACIQGGMRRVFRIGVNFRAEKRVSNRHLTQFTVVSFEMRLKEDGREIYEFLWKALSSVFSWAEKECERELKILRARFGESVGKVTIGEKPIVLKYDEVVEMVNEIYRKEKEKGRDVMELLKMGDDLRAEDERLLGKIVKEKYGSDFFVVTEYPFKLRGFCSKFVEDEGKGNSKSEGIQKAFSFDTFMKGEEISSGSEWENNNEKIKKRIMTEEQSILREGFRKLLAEGYKYGMPKAGGLAVGFDRLVKLFLGLEDIKSVVLFPRDYSKIDP